MKITSVLISMIFPVTAFAQLDLSEVRFEAIKTQFENSEAPSAGDLANAVGFYSATYIKKNSDGSVDEATDKIGFVTYRAFNSKPSDAKYFVSPVVHYPLVAQALGDALKRKDLIYAWTWVAQITLAQGKRRADYQLSDSTYISPIYQYRNIENSYTGSELVMIYSDPNFLPTSYQRLEVRKCSRAASCEFIVKQETATDVIYYRMSQKLTSCSDVPEELIPAGTCLE